MGAERRGRPDQGPGRAAARAGRQQAGAPLRGAGAVPEMTSPAISPATPAARAVKAVVLLACCAVVILPFIAVVSTSLAPGEQITRSGGLVLVPDHISFAAYKSILTGGVVTRATLVSLFITGVGTALSLAGTALLAYGLS